MGYLNLVDKAGILLSHHFQRLQSKVVPSHIWTQVLVLHGITRQNDSFLHEQSSNLLELVSYGEYSCCIILLFQIV